MKKLFIKKLNSAELKKLFRRKGINFDIVMPIVKRIADKVKINGDSAIRECTKRFDQVDIFSFMVTRNEIERAGSRIPQNVKRVFSNAAKNIKKFHELQIVSRKEIQTTKGVTCFTETRPIEKVGLYVPGGTAPLPSTVLMLSIPAKLAGCNEIILVTPPAKDGRVEDIVLFAASLCGIKKIYKIGGAQAIAALAYGTETVPKVDKIFGPGNQYVTAAKMLVAMDPEGAVIDMPAGPTEVLVIADEMARADFVASDLLAQAEHGTDSQAILVTTGDKKAEEVLHELDRQLPALPRKDIARKALDNSIILVVDAIEEALEFSNSFAPEHLILNVKNAVKYVSKINSAGSVFVGPFSCESAGDYASGTNHVLPTYGYARALSGISVGAFQKTLTFQKITKQGARNIGPIVATMASQESLDGHRKAMQLRYQ